MAVADAVILLREALNPELVGMGELAARIVPRLDAATFGSVLILYGVEITVGSGAASREEMAAHFRVVAEALDRGDPDLPVLTGVPPSEEPEPAF